MIEEASLSQRVGLVVQQDVVGQLAQIEEDIAKCRDGAIAWTFQGIRRMHDAGKLLTETQELLRGDFTDWFESNAEKIGYSLRTAGTYKKVFRDIERMGGFDQACEKFPDRHDFLVALGILKQREPEGLPGRAPEPTVRFSYCGPKPEELPPEKRRVLISQLEPAVQLHAALVAVEAE